MRDPVQKNKSSMSNWLVVLGLCFLVGMPILMYGCRDEMANWKMAAIVEEYEIGDAHAAIDSGMELFKTNSSSLPIGLALAELLVDFGQSEEALKICESLSKQTPDNIRLVDIQTLAMLKQEQFVEAIELAKQNNMRKSRLMGEGVVVSLRQNLAYFRALANVEIQEGKKHIDSIRKDNGLIFGNQTFIRVNLLNAIVNIESGNFLEAKHSLDVGIRTIEEALKNLEDQPTAAKQRASSGDNWKNQILIDPAFQLKPRDDLPALNHPIFQEYASQTLPLFYACRAKVFQELGDKKNRDNDLNYVLKKKLDPQSLLTGLPSGRLAGDQLRSLAGWVDTSACLHYRLNNFAAALREADAAIVAARGWIVAVETFKYYEATEGMTKPGDFIDFYENDPKEQLATLLFHRSWVHQAKGDIEAQQEDLQEIRDLGFEPDASLN